MKTRLILTLLISVFMCSPISGDDSQDKETKRQTVIINAKPLEQVIDIIRAGSGINIHVRWYALENEGIEKDTEISLRLHNVTWKKLLQLILDDAGAGEVELLYVDDDGILLISTKDDLAKDKKTKVYDLSDLLVDIPSFKGRKIDLNSIGQNSGQGGKGGGKFLGGGQGGASGSQGGGLFGDDGGEDEDIESPAINDIIDLIRQTIDPDSWNVSGEAISSLRSQIIVTHTDSVHKQLKDL